MDSKVYLQEAFKALDMLNEEDFNIDTLSGQEDFQKFQADEDEKSDFVDIIDPETTEEDELKDDYVGKIVLDCCVCHNKFYKDEDEIEFSEDEDVVNENEECPFCYATDGFKIIGMIAPYEESHFDDDDEKVESDEDGEIEIEDDEAGVFEESFRGRKKKLNEIKTPGDITSKLIDTVGSVLNTGTTGLSQVANTAAGKDSVLGNKNLGKNVSDVGDTFVKVKTGGLIKDDWDCDDCDDEWCEEEDECDESLLNPLETVGNLLGGVGNLLGGGQKTESCSVGKKKKSSKRSVKEDFERVEIETDKEKMEMTSDPNGKVIVSTEPKEPVVAPVSDEVQRRLNPVENPPEDEEEIEDSEEMTMDNFEDETPEDEEDISEFSEEDFDELGESYLRKIYENVNSYHTTNVYRHKNKYMIEGIIAFKSGNKKNTSFIFESAHTNGGRCKFIGENTQITRGKKAFTVSGKVKNGKFITESFNYNYRAKDNKGNSTRVYGTIKKH